MPRTATAKAATAPRSSSACPTKLCSTGWAPPGRPTANVSPPPPTHHDACESGEPMSPACEKSEAALVARRHPPLGEPAWPRSRSYESVARPAEGANPQCYQAFRELDRERFFPAFGMVRQG